MPWMAPSHPAPLLPLKLWKPTAFSGLALCLGAAVPDLEFVLAIKQDSVLSHTLVGQLLFTVPIVLVLHALLTAVVLPWLVPLFTFGAPWHFEDLARVRQARTTGEWVRVAVSGFIGGLSHLLLDGFTHGSATGWGVHRWPIFATPIPLPLGSVPFYDCLHVTLTVVLGSYGIWQAAHMGRRRLLADWYPNRESATREATPSERRGALGYFAACALLGFAVGAQRAHAHLEWIELGAFGMVAFTFYGLLLAAIADGVRRFAWSDRRLAWNDRKLELDPDSGTSSS
jgi:hypothetical protein